MPSPDSTLGHALLGLLHQGPRSGYDLRKTFASTPMGTFSDSPGAIYPALRRLVRRGWIAPRGGRENARRRQTFSPTPAGRRAFAQWLRQPASRDEVVRDWGVLMLRLAFMTGNLGAAEVVRFLEGLEAELSSYLEELVAIQTDGGRMPLSAELAFGSGVEDYRARSRWLRSAVERARRATRMS